jgi:hypothetical protein
VDEIYTPIVHWPCGRYVQIVQYKHVRSCCLGSLSYEGAKQYFLAVVVEQLGRALLAGVALLQKRRRVGVQFALVLRVVRGQSYAFYELVGRLIQLAGPTSEQLRRACQDNQYN